jgi:methyl-accepting chemotaxis protein
MERLLRNSRFEDKLKNQGSSSGRVDFRVRLALILGIAWVLLLFVMLANYRTEKQNRIDKAHTEANAAAEKVSSRVEENLSQYRKELLFTGANAALVGSITDPEQRAAEMQNVWKEMALLSSVNRGTIDENCLIAWVSGTGGKNGGAAGYGLGSKHGAYAPELARYTFGKRAPQADLSVGGQGEWKSEFFQPTLKMRRGQVYQNLYVSPDSNRWVIANATPLYIDGRPAAVWHYEINLASVWDVAQSTQKSIATELKGVKGTHVMIVDRGNNVVIDSGRSAPTVLPFVPVAKAGLGEASPESDKAVVATSNIDTGKNNTAKWTAVVTVPKTAAAAGLSVVPTIRNWLLLGVLMLLIPLLTVQRVWKGIDTRLGLLRGSMESVAAGDLSAPVPDLGDDAVGKSGAAFGRLVGSLRKMVAQVDRTAGSLRAASNDLASSSSEAGAAVSSVALAMEHISSGTTHQVDLVANSRATIDEMDALIRESAESSKATQQRAADAMRLAQSGVERAAAAQQAIESVSETAEQSAVAINSLNDQSGDIDRIVTSIQAIAEQTNLLSLNAAIEAARAGEQGRGFAVVAEEVRSLAEESREAAGEIAEIIRHIKAETGKTAQAVFESDSRVREGAEATADSREAFNEIHEAISAMHGSSAEAADLARRLDEAAARVMENIDEVSALAEQTSSSTEEMAASTEETNATTDEVQAFAKGLATTADQLTELLRQFKLDGEDAVVKPISAQLHRTGSADEGDLPSGAQASSA